MRGSASALVGVAGRREHGHAAALGEHRGRPSRPTRCRRGSGATGPGWASSPTVSEPWAVCSISGTAPSVAQSRSLVNGIDLPDGHAGVLGVAAVEGAAHAAHHRGDLLCRPRARRRGTRRRRRWPRCRARGGTSTPSASPRRVCSSERLSPNASTLISTSPGRGARVPGAPDLQRLGRPRRVEHDGTHRGRDRRSLGTPSLVGDMLSHVPHDATRMTASCSARNGAPSRMPSSSVERRGAAVETSAPGTGQRDDDERASSGFGERSHQPAFSIRSTSLLVAADRDRQRLGDVDHPTAGMPVDDLHRLEPRQRQIVIATESARRPDPTVRSPASPGR